jgi:hypothetical protein
VEAPSAVVERIEPDRQPARDLSDLYATVAEEHSCVERLEGGVDRPDVALDGPADEVTPRAEPACRPGVGTRLPRGAPLALGCHARIAGHREAAFGTSSPHHTW